MTGYDWFQYLKENYPEHMEENHYFQDIAYRLRGYGDELIDEPGGVKVFDIIANLCDALQAVRNVTLEAELSDLTREA